MEKRLNGDEDPDVWLTQLEDIRVRLHEAGGKITDEDFIEHVLNSLPKEYEITMKLLVCRLSDQTNPLTIVNLREELNLDYMRRSKSEQRKDSALYAGGTKKNCHYCGKPGHLKKNC